MADTRCVNPEYQVDVDVMILEHLLYQSIRAQFEVLRPKYEQQADDQTEDQPFKTRELEAERLLLAFSSFMQIFKHNHQDYVLSGGTSFNLALLETVVLLNLPRNLSPLSSPIRGSGSSVRSIPDLMRQHWLEELSRHLEDRREWLRRREKQGRSTDPNSPIPRGDILAEVDIASWTSFQEAHINSKESSPIAPLFSVLHRFMSLSSVIAPLMGDINDNFITLACQLMLQAALELLSFSRQPHSLSAEGKEKATNGRTLQLPGLIECFAFGYRPSLDTNSEEISESEHLINSMLASSSSSSTPTENPRWTALRSQYLSEFRLPSPPVPDTDPQPYHQRVARLRKKYPYADFEAKLLRCLEHFWILNCSDGMSGKPVLVQLEEGRLEGLNDAEFEEFLVRVGVERDERGMLKLKL